MPLDGEKGPSSFPVSVGETKNEETGMKIAITLRYSIIIQTRNHPAFRRVGTSRSRGRRKRSDKAGSGFRAATSTKVSPIHLPSSVIEALVRVVR